MLPEMNTESIFSSYVGKKIIYFQYLTIQMMYREIAKELKSVGSKSHPTDYLLFLCLGKQESRPNYVENGLTEPKPNSKESKWHNLSHFLIYVHSKLLIADDCYIV